MMTAEIRLALQEMHDNGGELTWPDNEKTPEIIEDAIALGYAEWSGSSGWDASYSCRITRMGRRALGIYEPNLLERIAGWFGRSKPSRHPTEIA